MRIAVITGASMGLGREFARQIPKCYRSLDEIWLIARNTDKLEEVKAGAYICKWGLLPSL